jgi:quinol-cytochrome oxidoreductase complex cytochrome b subunit
VPFLDRGAARRGRSPVFTAIGVVAILFVVGMTAWGYHSWMPVWAALGGAVFMAILAWVVRPGPSHALGKHSEETS